MPNQYGQTVASFTLATDLISDKLAVVSPPINASSPAQFAIAQKGLTGLPEPVVVNGDGTVWYYRTDPSSQSGYTAERINALVTPGNAQPGIVGLYAFYDTSAQPNVIATWKSSVASNGIYPLTWLWFTSSGPGTWAPPTTNTAELAALTSVYEVGVYEDQEANPFVYFLTTALTGSSQPALYIASLASGTLGWVPASALPSSVTQADSIYAIFTGMPGSGDQFTIMGVVPGTATLNYLGGSLPAPGSASLQFDLTETGTLNPNLPANQTILELIAAPGIGNDIFILTLDSSTSTQRLFLLANYAGVSPALTELTSATGEKSVKNVCVDYDAEGAYAVFASDAVTNHLLVARQADPNTFAFPDWSDLNIAVSSVATPPFMFDGLEVFYVDDSNTLQFKSQTAEPDNGGVWTTQAVAQAAQLNDGLASTCTYTVQAATLDSGGRPVPFATGTFTTDIATNPIVNGMSMPFRPGQEPLPVQANFDGCFVFQFPLDQRFSAPQLTLCLDDLPQSPQSIYLDVATLPRMAGQDPTCPVTASTIRPLVGKQEDDGQLTNWITSIQELVAVLQQSRSAEALGSTDALAAISSHAWVYSRPSPGAPLQVQQVSSLEAAIRAGNPSAGLLDWTQEVFGDLVEYAWNGVTEITDFGWEVVSGTVQYWVKVGTDKITQALNSISPKLEAILKYGMRFLAAAEQTIEQWANFFATILNWSDIVNTQKVLAHVITQSLTFASNWIETTGGPWVQNQLNALAINVSAAFASLSQQLGQNTLTSMVQDQGANPTDLSSTGVAGVINSPQNDIALKWLYSRTIGNTQVMSQLNAATVSVPSNASPFSAFYSTFSTQLTALNSSSSADWQNLLERQLTLQNVTALSTIALNTFLTAFQAFIQDVLSALSQLAGAAAGAASAVISAVQTVLTTPLTNISLLNDLFGAIADDQTLNILNLTTLLAAVPVTTAYKLVQGTWSPAPPFTQAYVDSLLPSSSIILPLTQSTDAISAGSINSLGFIAGVFQCVQTFWDSINDLQYVLRSQDLYDGDANPLDASLFAQACGLVNLLGGFILGSPFDALQQQASARTPADKATIAGWALLLPILVAEGFLVAADGLAEVNQLPGGLTSKLLDWPLKPMIKGATGAIGLLGGVIAATAQFINSQSQPNYTPLTAASALLTPIPQATRIGLLLYPNDSTKATRIEPVAVAYAILQAALDTVGTFTPGLLECINFAAKMNTAPQASAIATAGI